MKKLFLSLVLTVLVAASSFAADVNKVNYSVENKFAADFAKAKDVSWITTENFVKASFTLNNTKMEAYYDLKGDLIGTMVSIAIDELPTKAKRDFAKKFDGYTVQEVLQFDTPDELSYYISAENETQSVILKVSEYGAVSVLKIAKK